MSGNLIIPRCEVQWGKVNLTCYNGTDEFPQQEPLVFNVEMQMEGTNNSPTASMSWNPTGPAFQVYEKFITDEKKLLEQITIRFFYAGGKSIVFPFLWSGQSVAYGNDMSIKVKMKSELEGMVNSNLRSTAIPEEKTYLDGVKQIETLYGLKDKNLVTFSESAQKSMKKAKIENAYGTDLTFGANVSNMVKQNGNVPFAHNIGKAGIAVLTPFSYDKDEVVYNGADIPPQENPDPSKRYGYLLGPSVINSITRESDWIPPQQTKTNTPNTQTKAVKEKEKNKKKNQSPPSAQAVKTEETKKPTSAPLGTSSARPNPGISNKENKEGVEKQNALEEENTAKLSLQTFMTPVLTGLKPHDILYIPSLTGKYIEDWIVQSVGYSQTDGAVELSINASRKQGLGTPMNEKAAKKFQEIAMKLTTLEAWEEYAWSFSRVRNSSVATMASTPKEKKVATLAAQAQELREMRARSLIRQGV